MDIEKFKELIKERRVKVIPSASILTLNNFEKLGFTNQSEEYFLSNASYIMESLRTSNWEEYLKLEEEFSGEMYESLIDKNKILDLDNIESIKWFVENFPDHIYRLSLSNTQSRRSRAGKEFELIIELILMGANIPFDTQGSIGSGVFESSELAKLVDCVSPGALEYKLDKRNTSLISAKTTLRERWQEVGDEMARTKAREMYLVTLDENITSQTMKLISANNIVIVTTNSILNDNYKKMHGIISVEEMLQELKTKSLVWNTRYSKEAQDSKLEDLKQKKSKSSHSFIKQYYQNQIKLF
ncbi:type II restriction endonuclease [Staphylococcus pseudintermedius]|uniref:type II restriction endonuclease n=1 Tax=Staphylococcus pseudintermedius TaxID=283734 RepID=UPI000BBC2D33|nr:type II restriction endonuclease [Staphylococcus pseudintermedius]PCE18931.1 restriction endonuclease [Staphylococcus pseudintermedius]